MVLDELFCVELLALCDSLVSVLKYTGRIGTKKIKFAVY